MDSCSQQLTALNFRYAFSHAVRWDTLLVRNCIFFKRTPLNGSLSRIYNLLVLLGIWFYLYRNNKKATLKHVFTGFPYQIIIMCRDVLHSQKKKSFIFLVILILLILFCFPPAYPEECVWIWLFTNSYYTFDLVKSFF